MSKGDNMRKKQVFVSFDYDNDKHYKFLLQAWDANPEFDFVFEDKTPGEIKTNDIGRIKAGLTRKINEASHTLFIVGKHANQPHKDRNAIGFINWINYEAYQSIQSDNYLAVVKLDDSCGIPNELKARYWWISGFSEINVIKVLNDSSK
jgi:Thoeris protein ThsB, TIR-like domain